MPMTFVIILVELVGLFWVCSILLRITNCGVAANADPRPFLLLTPIANGVRELVNVDHKLP